MLHGKDIGCPGASRRATRMRCGRLFGALTQWKFSIVKFLNFQLSAFNPRLFTLGAELSRTYRIFLSILHLDAGARLTKIILISARRIFISPEIIQFSGTILPATCEFRKISRRSASFTSESAAASASSHRGKTCVRCDRENARD